MTIADAGRSARAWTAATLFKPLAITPATSRARWWFVKPTLFGMSVAAAVVVWATWYGGGLPVDAAAFYDPMYGRTEAAYVWTPAFAQLTSPLRLLPFDAFVGLVRLLELAAIVAMAPYAAWIAIFLPPVAAEINMANINMLLILAVVASRRFPWAWTLPLLTKPSMGLAIAWSAARRDRRTVIWAIAPAVLIGAISVVLDPAEWLTFVRTLLMTGDTPGWPFPIPIWPRIPIALAIAILGRNRGWALPLAAIIAMPKIYFTTPAMLLGLLPMLMPRDRDTSVGKRPTAMDRLSQDPSENQAA